MNHNDDRGRWTWNPGEHPRVAQLFSSPAPTSNWQDENVAGDAITGKVLSVVAGITIARAVIERIFPGHERRNEALDLLNLGDAWINDPTDDRFDAIARFLFEDDRKWMEPNDPLKVAWGALRVATSSVGNYEAGWALSIVVDDANKTDVDAAFMLGSEVEREPWGRNVCDRAWNFDVECIEDTGSYVTIVENLCRVAGTTDLVFDLEDFVDIENDTAWLKYTIDGKRRHFNIPVDNDWADPETVSAVMRDIERNGKRFYGKDNGQASIWFYLDKETANKLNELTGNALKTNE